MAKSLWSLGISGDFYRIVIIEDDAILRVIGTHFDASAAGENGVTDLVYLMKGGGDYRSTYRNNLISILRTSGLEGRLSARGGIHLADLSSHGAETVRAVSAWLVKSHERLPKIKRTETYRPVTRQLYGVFPEQELVYRYNKDYSFSFDINGKLPLNAWSHMLAE